MNKKQVQQKVLQDGKPLDLDKFTWCEKTRTFSSIENSLVLDFHEIGDCTFNTGSNCTFKTGFYCTFDTGSDCTFNTSFYCTFKTDSNCTFKTGFYCTFKTDSGCTFNTGSDCTFNTGSDCTFNTGFGCTFDTGSDCTFNTSFGCTFNTGSDCTFKTGSWCTFNTGFDCVIVRRGVFEVIQPKKDDIIQICPSPIKGYLVNGLYNGEPHIIADGILSKVISKKGSVYKVINHGETKESYLIESEVNDKKVYSHGETLKEARNSLIYKLADRDTSKYQDLTIDSILTKEEAIQCYMAITGACASGTKYFVDNMKEDKEKASIREIIQITNGQFGNEIFYNFFTKEVQSYE